jgi:hypothetical protein
MGARSGASILPNPNHVIEIHDDFVLIHLVRLILEYKLFLRTVDLKKKAHRRHDETANT